MQKYFINLLMVLIFVPAFFVLLIETNSFQQPVLLTDLIAPAVTLFAGICLLCHRYLVTPSRDFLKVINRAIHGDYRARFSCNEENEAFRNLSLSFNQLMSVVEKQDRELAENRHLQNSMYQNEKIYRSALELTCERVFEADLTHNKMVYGLDRYARTFPFSNSEIYDEMVRQLADIAVHADDRELYYQTFCRNSLFQRFSSNSNEVTLEFRQKADNGKVYWVSATMIHLNDSDDGNVRVIGYVKNIDQRKRLELEILKQSQKDGLTGLYNKKVTQDLIDNFLQGEGITGQHAVIMIDIDNFKNVNDTLGHLQGDAALVKVSEQLQKLFRSNDIAGRVGGDEFLVLLKNYADLDQLIRKLISLCDMFRCIELGEDAGYHISGSVGVALYPTDGDGLSELYKEADISLYYAKAHGKNCYCIYNSSFGNVSGLCTNHLPQTDIFSGYIPREKPIDNSLPMDEAARRATQQKEKETDNKPVQ